MLSESIAQYGRALKQYGGITDTAPSVTIPIEKIPENFDYLLNNQTDESFQTGFFVLLMPILHTKWETYSPIQTNKLKSDLIRCININFPNLFFTHQFTSLVTNVFKLSDGNWPELVKLIFEENEIQNKEIIGFLISKLVRYLTPEQLETNGKKIYDMLFELIPDVSCPIQLRLLNIFVDLQGFTLTAPFWSLFWSTAVSCIKEDKKNEINIWFTLFHFHSHLRENEKIEPPLVDSDDDYLLLITFISLFNCIDFGRAINRIITIISSKIESEDDKSLAVFEAMKLVNSRSISPEMRTRAIDLLKSALAAQENVNEAVFVIMPFVPDAIHVGIKIEDVGLSFLSDFPTGTSLQQQLWCRAMCLIARPLINSKLIPTNTQMYILSMAQSSNPVLSNLAFDALRALFESFAVTDPEPMKLIFNTYDKLSDAQKVRFTRTIQVLVESGGFDASLLQPIEEFIRSSLRTTNNIEIQTAVVSLISSLSNINSAIIVGYVKEMLPFIVNIVNSKRAELIPDAAHLLLLFSVLQPSLTRRSLTNLYPKLLQFAKQIDSSSENESKSESESGRAEVNRYDKERGKVGESIAGLVEAVFKRKELTEAMNLVSLFLRSNRSVLVISATNMIHVLQKLLSQSTSSPLYSELARAALQTSDERVLNRTVESMRKLFKQFPMNQSVTLRFSYYLLTEMHQIFVKQSIYNWICTKASLFPFITLVIEKMPKEVNILIPVVVNICKNSTDEMFTLIFDTIAAAFSVGLVKELPSKRLYEVCYKDVFNHHSTIALSFVIEKISDELGEFNEKLQEEWRSIASSNNKEDQLLWKCAVSDALVQLAARNQKIDMEIFKAILNEFPFKADFGFCEELCLHLMEAFKNNEEMLQPLEIEYVKAFADFFMLEKSDMLAFRVGYDVQMEMKAEMRRVVKRNKVNEKEMVKHYSKNKNKLNMFFSFIQ